ncbi:MAG: BadF/BadG/BcrA/BcrD ATPase family protein [Oscillospiraceae bacterium]
MASLLKSAFRLDEGEVETIAHYQAAAFFDPEVDCILDIGGQDMKCIKIRNHSVDTILLNEACSSGCGSFIENFANSLGYTAAQFAQEALFAPNPIDQKSDANRVYELQCEASPEGRGLGPGYFIRSCLFCH